MKALAICSRLLAAVRETPLSGTVYAVFDHAVDLAIDGRYGLVGMIASEKTLTPYAVHVRAERPFSDAGIRVGMAVRLRHETLCIPEARITLSLMEAEPVDLSLDGLNDAAEAARMDEATEAIRIVLGEADELGLSSLVTGRQGNVYTEFLRPRLNELFCAMASEDAGETERCARRVAGCGMGLTPSSDDLLCGYFAALYALEGAGRLDFRARSLLPVAAGSAAKGTNRISGTFLLQSGEGLVSRDILELIRSVLSGADRSRAERDARRVASIGSTSGGDMLTGLALAILHHDGGKNRGSTGNQKKCLL